MFTDMHRYKHYPHIDQSKVFQIEMIYLQTRKRFTVMIITMLRILCKSLKEKKKEKNINFWINKIQPKEEIMFFYLSHKF